MQQGWRRFLVLWLGQSVSLLGTRLSAFALSIWVYQRTGSVTLFGTVVVISTLPGILSAPWAGALVDRWNRRLVMLLADAVAALATLTAALLLTTGRLELWHVGLLLAVGSIFDSIQRPAYLASVTTLVDKERFGRTSGMMQLSQAGARILAPALAGFLIDAAGVAAVLWIDLATFFVALVSLALIRIPEPRADSTDAAATTLRQEVLQSWSFLRQRPGLMKLLLLAAGTGFVFSMLEVLMLPLVMSFASVAVAGAVATVVGAGMFLGSLAMSLWGGPRDRIRAILLFSFFQGIALILAGLRADATWVAAAFFLFSLSMPVVSASNQVIWQRKVPAGLQGRVFALRRMISQSVAPLGMILAGPLAEGFFTPLLAGSSSLATALRHLVGDGPGRGMGLMLVALGATTLLIVLAGTSMPRLRRLEDEMADAETAVDGER